MTASVLVPTAAEARRGHHQHHHRGRTHVAKHGGGYNPPFAAMVVDANSGRTMYAVAEDEPRHPASITKVMTLYLLFDALERGQVSLDTEFQVSAHAAAQAPSKLGLRPSDTISVEDCIKAVVTKSANDVAVVIAENLGGSESGFAERMTRKARQLGMSGTTYVNASGLPASQQITTARDLTILARAIQDKFPSYYKYFQTRVFYFAGHPIPSHNRLVGRVEGVDGIKTGFTNASGFNLMTNARLDGRHVVGIILGGRSTKSRDDMMAQLIRTNLARASVGTENTRYADADDDARTRARPEDVETTSATGFEPRMAARAGRPLDLGAMRAAVATAPDGAGTTTPTRLSSARPPLPPVAVAYASASESEPLPRIPTPPPMAQKIEARLPSAIVLPVQEQPPARAELASAKPIRVAALETKRGGERPARITPWVIQLAAEADETRARAILDQAQARASRALAHAAPFTERVVHGGSTLYRARFSGFSEADSAQDACRTLKNSGFACFATRS